MKMKTKRTIKNKSSTGKYYITNNYIENIKKLCIVFFINVLKCDLMILRFLLCFGFFSLNVTCSNDMFISDFQIVSLLPPVDESELEKPSIQSRFTVENTKIGVGNNKTGVDILTSPSGLTFENSVDVDNITDSDTSTSTISTTLEDFQRDNFDDQWDIVDINSSETVEDSEKQEFHDERDIASRNPLCWKDELKEWEIIDVDREKCQESTLNDKASIKDSLMMVLEDSYDDNTRVFLKSDELFVRILKFISNGQDSTNTGKMRQRFIKLFNDIVKKGVEILYHKIFTNDSDALWEILQDYLDIEWVKRFVVTINLKSFLILRISDELNDLVLKNCKKDFKMSNTISSSKSCDLKKKLGMLFIKLSKYLNECENISENDYNKIKNRTPSELEFKWLTNKVFSHFLKKQIKKLKQMQTMGSIEEFYLSHSYCIFEEFISFIFLEIISVERLNYILSEEILTFISHYKTTNLVQKYMKYLMLAIKKDFDIDLDNKIQPKLDSYVHPIDKSEFSKFLHQKLKKIHPFFSYMNIESNFISCLLSLLFSKEKINEMNKKLEDFKVIREASDEELYKLENVKDILQMVDVVFKEFMGYSTLEERVKFYQTHYEIIFKCEYFFNLPKIIRHDRHQSYHEFFYFYIMRINLVSSYLSIHKFNFHLITSKKDAVPTKFNKSEIEKDLESPNESQKNEKFSNFYYNFHFNRIKMYDLDSYEKECEIYTNIYKKNLKDFQIFKSEPYSKEAYPIYLKEICFFIDEISKGLVYDSMQGDICYEKFFYFFKSEIYIDHYLVIAEKQINYDLSQNREENTFFKKDSCYFFRKPDTVYNGDDKLKTIRLELHEIIYLSSYFKKNLHALNFWKLKKNAEIETIVKNLNKCMKFNFLGGPNDIKDGVRVFLLNFRRVQEYLNFLEKYHKEEKRAIFELIHDSFKEVKQKFEYHYKLNDLQRNKPILEFENFIPKFEIFITESHKSRNQEIRKLKNNIFDLSISLKDKMKITKEMKTKLRQMLYVEINGLDHLLKFSINSKFYESINHLNLEEFQFYEKIKQLVKDLINKGKKFTNKLLENISLWDFDEVEPFIKKFDITLNEILENFVSSDLKSKESLISEMKKYIKELMENFLSCDFADKDHSKNIIKEYIDGIVLSLKSYDFQDKKSTINEIENIFQYAYIEAIGEEKKKTDNEIVNIFSRKIEEMEKEMKEFQFKISEEIKKTEDQVYENVLYKTFRSSKERRFYKNFKAYLCEYFSLETGDSTRMKDNEFMKILKGNNRNLFDLDQYETATNINVIACFEALMTEFVVFETYLISSERQFSEK